MLGSFTVEFSDDAQAKNKQTLDSIVHEANKR